MSKAANDVVISGIGIVTCQGVGKDAHIALLSAASAPKAIVETEKFKPYPVHPLPEIDWSQQIAKRGDQRQMENWQRIGVFAAGLALDDAGFKDDIEACGTMDMIVAAGGGERDINVDTLIVDEALKRNDRELLLNEKLTTELRPTLFLAQLSNLLAGNISIVHKVTGSSRTFMGEEAAGISAVETAFYRIKSGESSHALVGGAFAAERPDMILLTEAIGAHARGDWVPLWSRKPSDGGGMITGSAGAFWCWNRASMPKPAALISMPSSMRSRVTAATAIPAISRFGWSGFWGRQPGLPLKARRSFPARPACTIWPPASGRCSNINCPTLRSVASAALPAIRSRRSSRWVWRSQPLPSTARPRFRPSMPPMRRRCGQAPPPPL